MESSRPKRPKAPPPRLNLEEMEHDPSMRGMLSFLEISPAEKLEMLRKRAVVEGEATTVAVEPAAVVVETPTTVASEDTVTAGPADTVVPVLPEVWYTEGTEGVFPASRVRRIGHALDALCAGERAVYAVLGGPGDAADEPFRLASAGYDTVAKGACVTKMNAKRIIERLIDKGFLKIDRLADPLRRVPTRYQVFSYTEALRHMTKRSRFHVVRSGNGVLFAHPLRPTDTVASGS